MYTLYLDETGDWGYPNCDPKHPVLCLCGAIALNDYYSKEIIPSMEYQKRKHFHNAHIVLHRYKVRRRKEDFRVLKTVEQMKAFTAKFSQYIATLDIKILIASLDKIQHYRTYGTKQVDKWLPEDIYSMLLVFVVERFVAFLWELTGVKGNIIAESRGTTEDNFVQYQYSAILRNGTQYYHNWQLQKALPTAIEFKKKSDNVLGLQISDWIAFPFSQKTLYPNGSRDEFRERELYKDKIWIGVNAPAPGQVGFKTFPSNLGRKLLNMPLKSV